MTTRKTNDFVDKKMHGLKQGLMNLVSRFILKKADDSKKMQEVSGEMFSDETKEELEHFQCYGFTSNPPADSEGIALSVNGNRNHTVVVCLDSREYRLKDLAPGEAAVYNNAGTKVVLKANGDIIMTSPGNIELNCPGGTLKIDATDIDMVQQGTTMNDYISTYNTHTHNETGSVTNQPNQTI